MINRKRTRPKSTKVSKSKIKGDPNTIKAKINIKKKFMAKLREDGESGLDNIIEEKKNNELKEILKGDDIIFEMRKNKAQQIFKEIDKLDINNKIYHETIKDKINIALEYDNVKKENIYKSIKYFYKMNDKINFEKTLNKAKYCLTKKFNLEQNNNNNNIVKNIVLSEEIKLPKGFVIFEDEADLIKEIKNALKSLESIYEGIDKVTTDSLTKPKILKSKLIKTKKNLFVVEQKHSTNEDLKNIYDAIYNYLYYSMFINDFQYYGENQPLDYDYNSTIYLINIFHRIYYNTTKFSNWGKIRYISIDENKMAKLYSMKDYKNHIFELLKNNNNKINKEIDDKLDNFFYYLESENFPEDLGEIMNKSIKANVSLNSEKIKKFIENSKDDRKQYKYDDKILYLTYENKKYQYNYKCYNDYLLNSLKVNKIPEFIEEQQWNKISMISYFDEDDVAFLKNLIKKILKSKLFKEVYSNYSDVNNYVDYYFNEEKNIDDMLNKIKFFSFDEKNTRRQGATFPKNLKIIVSSVYISNISSKKDFINYKLLEIGRKLIIILLEIVHYLKRALNMLTNGNIMGTIIENENEDPNIIEGGRLFEKIFFNWDNNYIKNRTKSAKKKQGNNAEEEDSIRFLNIKRALKILDSNTYNSNIDDFQKYFESDEENKFETMDKDLKDYIEKIKFDLKDYYKNTNSYKSYRIVCSRKGINPYFIEYISDNHNYPYKFNEPKIKFFPLSFY